MSDGRFAADYAKRLSKCKKCKEQIEKGELRLAKMVPNHFGSDEGDMKQYFHPKCLFDTFAKARSTTKIIESPDEIDDFKNIQDKDKKEILQFIEDVNKNRSKPKTKNENEPKKVEKKQIYEKIKPKAELESEEEAKAEAKLEVSTDEEEEEEESVSPKKEKSKSHFDEKCEDNKFETFQTICNRIANDSSHLKKTAILKEFFTKGITGKGYKGDQYIFLKLILPSASTRVFNLNSKQLVKLFSKIFGTSLEEMSDHLNKGDVSDTCSRYLAKSNKLKPAEKSTLTIKEVDDYLDQLTQVTKEQDQQELLEEIAAKCTKNDLRSFIRLIKKDLRIDAGAKNILEGLAPNAYAAFQVSRDLEDVVRRANQKSETKPGLKKDLSIRIKLMTPVKPMLADACKSAEQAFAKLKNGVLVEIKYDGERLQVHKDGAKFCYFSRNLKSVQPHKVAHLKEFIPKAFPKADQLILDGEVLLYDMVNKKPLPFGTLGVHKKSAFKDATVCLFVFDCIFLNGEDLVHKTMLERRKLLEDNIKEIPGRIMLSDQKLIKTPKELRNKMMSVINEGLEGLVLKDTKSIYEPGKRHWLKMKKDYLEEGSMADTADLVVLGAYYGTGNKGGMKSVFLMGAFSEKRNKWYTVTKVGNGLDDKTLEKLQKQIEMEEIKKNFDALPDWLVVDKSLTPDFVVKNPKKSPVWELTGAEFSKSDKHTADGISIRFPRVTRIRDDKSWKEATSLERLKELYKISKEKSDFGVDEEKEDGEDEEEEEKKKTPKIEKKPTKRSSLPEKTANKEEEEATTPKKMKKVEGVETKTPDFMPSIFTDKIFLICKNVPKAEQLKRYIITYNGEVVMDEKCVENVTNVVFASADQKIPESCPKKAIKMSDEQLWDCIKKKKYDEKNFVK